MPGRLRKRLGNLEAALAIARHITTAHMDMRMSDLHTLFDSNASIDETHAPPI